MRLQITTTHYDFTLISSPEREDSRDISDVFSRMADIITKLQASAEEAEAMVVDKLPTPPNDN